MSGQHTGVSAIMANLANLLPTGTYLTFQTLAPLFTNNGECGNVERIMTGILVGFFFALCFLLNFVDSVSTESGMVYYGIVTTKGLFNPRFKRDQVSGDLIKDDNYFIGEDADRYKANAGDYINGFLDVIAFGTLSLLTAPITTCFYPNIPATVVKTAPILVALIVSTFFAFAPPGRNGIGSGVTNKGCEVLPEKLNRPKGPKDSTNRDDSPHYPLVPGTNRGCISPPNGFQKALMLP